MGTPRPVLLVLAPVPPGPFLYAMPGHRADANAKLAHHEARH